MSSLRIAIVLCGGRGRRLGTDKATAEFRDSTLLRHVLAAIEPVAGQIAIVGQIDQRPQRMAAIAHLKSCVTLVDDLVPDRGPLEGLRAGLRSFQRLPADTPIFVCGCDQPLLTAGVVEWMFAQIAESDEAGVPQLDEKLAPLPGIYRLRVLPTVERLLDQGERSLQALLAAVPATLFPREALRSVDPDLHALRSANTPSELADLARISQNKS